MPTEEPNLNTTIRKLGEGFEEFKARHNDQLRDVVARVDEMELSQTRPGIGGSGKSVERKAENNALRVFLRNGDESELKGMSVGTDPAGGYLVLPSFSDAMTKVPFETSPVRALARVVSIDSSSFEEIVDRQDAGAAWVGETEARTETTTPDLGKKSIVVHEMTASPRLTQKLIDDASIDVIAWLVEKMTDRFNRLEATAFISGNGVGQPMGIISNPTAATADDSRAWGTLEHIAAGQAGDWAASNPSDKLYDVVYSLKAQYRDEAAWMMPRSLANEIRQFKDSNGVYLWQQGLKVGEPSTLLGFPVYYGEDLPAKAANSLSILFGNFRLAYTIVDRIGIRLLRDPYTAKPHVILYTTKRVGGDVVNYEAIKVIKFAAS
jgi:HK97 family phage major capsid protein